VRSGSLAIVMLSIISTSALADETLKWRHVQHTASLQTLQVGDVNGHALNIYRLPGMAFFPDGSTGTTLRLLYLAPQMSLMVLGQLTAT
jgi:hypothetical protein